MALDLVLLGNLLVDDIVCADGQAAMGEPGGAMLYASLAARLWGARVGLVSVVGSDYPAATIEALAERGVDLAGLRALGRPGVRTWLLYEPGGRRVIHHLGCATHLEASPALGDIPASFASARAFHLSPMPIARQLELAAGLAERAEPRRDAPAAHRSRTAGAGRPLVSLDPHEPMHGGNLEEWRPVLDRVDAFAPGTDELKLAGASEDPAAAIERVPAARLRFVVLKRGAAGGVLVDRVADQVYAWPARAPRVVDTTGAGDAFMGGFLAGWLAHGAVERSIEQGIVGASFALEAWGARGLMAGTRDAAERRLEDVRGVVQRTTRNAFMLGWNRHP